MSDLSPQAEVTLLELLDRLLHKGVVLSGEITLSVADIDLVYIGLRLLISSIESLHATAGPSPVAADPEGAKRGRS